ncbi:hypothetical protein BDF20DRAFT_990432 [Mycotypha africana]|uniref:uncharacterized protein n=1 Tax=Mycotypha africana TaxID=64632 RepID=UPI0023008462|nr:uncharacterized protein BDF20DRAFT_990432 [Mycotypha africana]KAI8970122.1 hypothetical protein BDF20DRAFT_990432 [Mycotypha africana]
MTTGLHQKYFQYKDIWVWIFLQQQWTATLIFYSANWESSTKKFFRTKQSNMHYSAYDKKVQRGVYLFCLFVDSKVINVMQNLNPQQWIQHKDLGSSAKIPKGTFQLLTKTLNNHVRIKTGHTVTKRESSVLRKQTMALKCMR